MLATKPALTASTPLVNTIGIVDVNVLATRPELFPPVAMMTATSRAIRSAANLRSRSRLLSANRYSTATF
jgi:hypothetical protein